MTAWTEPDRTIVSRYLGQLRLRSAHLLSPGSSWLPGCRRATPGY